MNRTSEEFECKFRAFSDESAGDAMRAAAAWVEEEYAGWNPHAINVTWDEGTGWEILVVLGP